MEQARGVPVGLSSFVGRKREIAELRRLAAHTRILTVLGPGGAGKTRLATQFARQQQSRFADGSLLVELAEVRDPAMVAEAVARAAEITLQDQDTMSALSRRLADKQVLVLVDNCEHLVDAVAEVVARLLGQCERLSVLATSRERLNVEGETAYRLSSLALPETADAVEEAAGSDAVRLFVDRGRSARPGFDLDSANVASVVAICRRLDGMPLAIELAAARVATLSTVEIAARLDDRLALLTGGSRTGDERHQTLRSTLDWSYDLLDHTERTLLRRLSVFAGGFRLDAVVEITGFDPLDRASVVNGLQQLADKSALQAEPDASGSMRYRLLETIREYAAGKLAAADGEDTLRDRHLAFYSRLADEAFEARMRRGALPEHRRLWSEIADVRAALDRAASDSDTEVALLGNLRYVWMMYAPGEGLRRLNQTLSKVERKPTTGLVRAYWIWHALNGRAGRRSETLISPQELGLMAHEAGEDRLAPAALLGVAYLAERVERDLDKAREALELAVGALQATGNQPDLAMALASLGAVQMQLGHLDPARGWIDRALVVAQDAEDDYGAIGAYYTRGWLETLAGELEAARGSFLAGLEVVEESDLLSIAQQVEGIAATLPDQKVAVTLFGAAAKLRQEIASRVTLPWSQWVEPAIAAARAQLSAHDAEAAWEAGQEMTLAQLLSRARAAAGTGSTDRAKARRKGAGGLSRRELEVARLVAAGTSNRDIAQRFFLSERTVESHVDHILGKLNFNSRAEVARWVGEQGLAEQEAS